MTLCGKAGWSVPADRMFAYAGPDQKSLCGHKWSSQENRHFSPSIATLHAYFPNSPQAELKKLSDEIEKLRKSF